MGGQSLSRFILPAAALALAVLAVLAVLDRLGDNARAAARQALLARAATLAQSALVPGSMLPCVDGTSGEAVGNACEAQVFASAESTAAAVSYMAARIDLLRDAEALAKRGDQTALGALASTRRAVMLDRYGIAAHVLSERDGCTASKCAVFSMLDEADALKANIKAQIFDQYVSRYAAKWNAPVPAKAPESGPAVSALPAPAEPANEARAEAVPPPAAATVHKPVSPRWHFPSADSIPAVSIMTPEPKLSKDMANALERDTDKKLAIERRKEGKPPQVAPSGQDAKTNGAKKEAEQKPQAPGAPLQLTR